MRKDSRAYSTLSKAVANAVALIDEMNFGAARETLIGGQRMAEELCFLETEETAEKRAGQEEDGH